jgi:hypothetical protein
VTGGVTGGVTGSVTGGGGAPRRYAVVGTGARAGLYLGALAHDYADLGRITAWCDPNPVRLSYYDEMLEAAGRARPALPPRGFRPAAGRPPA